MTGIQWIQLGGRVESNVGTQALVNNTIAQLDLTVPAYRRWYLYGGRISNGDSVARLCSVTIRNGAGTNVVTLLVATSIAAGAESAFPPNTAIAGNYNVALPIPLAAGWLIRLYWAAGGASAGGTAQYSALVLEVPEQ